MIGAFLTVGSGLGARFQSLASGYSASIAAEGQAESYEGQRKLVRRQLHEVRRKGRYNQARAQEQIQDAVGDATATLAAAGVSTVQGSSVPVLAKIAANLTLEKTMQQRDQRQQERAMRLQMKYLKKAQRAAERQADAAMGGGVLGFLGG